jgi:hypothetical protein
MALTCGIFWAIACFSIALANQVWPGYGVAFLGFMDSVYPGYAPGGFGSVINGTLYALVDGAIAGAIFAWLYNKLLKPKEA